MNLWVGLILMCSPANNCAVLTEDAPVTHFKSQAQCEERVGNVMLGIQSRVNPEFTLDFKCVEWVRGST